MTPLKRHTLHSTLTTQAMNLNKQNSKLRDLLSNDDSLEPIAMEDELRDLAEDIVRYCPSLTHLLLALGSGKEDNPLKDLN